MNFVRTLIFSVLISFCFTLVYAQNASVEVDGHKYFEFRSSHFIVYFDEIVPESYPVQMTDRAELLYSRITEDFGFTRDNIWTWDNRAKIFVAKDKDAYVQYFGCAAWSTACVDYYSKRIFTFYGQDGFDSALAHEMAHVILREYIKGVEFPVWFDEGVAQYVEEKNAQVPREQEAVEFIRSLIAGKKYFPFNELFSTGLTQLHAKKSEDAQIFYAQAVSIVHFVIKKYGRDTFGYFLFCLRNGEDFYGALFKAFPQLENTGEFEKKWAAFYTE